MIAGLWDLLERWFGGGFMPHGHCYLWTPPMVWAQVSSNALIGVSYLSISFTLWYLVQRVKLPFSWVYVAFGGFILACGLTHFLDVVTVWHPIYWLDAGVRIVTAVASVATAVLLFPLAPKVITVARVTAAAKLAHEELRRSEERLRLLIESVKDYAIFTLDPTGVVTTWNAGARRLKGYEAGQIIGQHFSRFYPEDDGRDAKCQWELETAVREGRFEEEGWRVRADGSQFWANVVLTPILDPNGSVLGFAKVTRDLTERRQAEDARSRLAAENATLSERARTQEFQERFLAILGHDLRNPLAALEMGTELLRKTSAPKDLKILQRMESSAHRMSRMVEQILDLTRSRLGGGLEVQTVALDLTESLVQVVDEIRLAHPARPIVLRSTHSLFGMWDRDRMEQVLSNLIGNAIQHGTETTPVTVEAGQDDKNIFITVHNFAPAISEQLLVRVFEPFGRGARDSRTSRTSGLGLGLFISREIVKAHRGTLEVESTDAAGTTFRLSFPRPAA